MGNIVPIGIYNMKIPVGRVVYIPPARQLRYRIPAPDSADQLLTLVKGHSHNNLSFVYLFSVNLNI